MLTAQDRLWGLTSAGGDGAGAIINIKPDGTDFHSFPIPNINGAAPQGSLIKASNGKFYGLTFQGGIGWGVLFEFDPTGSDTYEAIHIFFPTTGRNPTGSLIEYNGKLYGMTNQGGSGDGGVIFEYDLSGSGGYTVKHHFALATGGAPNGSLIEFAGKLYGLTSASSSGNLGTLFEYDLAGSGTYLVRHHFSIGTGARPLGTLMLSGAKFYGTTTLGGSNSAGVLFEFDPAGSGTYAVKHHFATATGRIPTSSLLAYDGKFYGMTNQGGSSNAGVLFEYDPVGIGTYTPKVHFNNSNGGGPRGGLIEYDGRLYGMTATGGSTNGGVLFEYDPTGGGVYTVKHHFDHPTGRFPTADVIESDGKLYGMTNSGGNTNSGVLFEFDPTGAGSYDVKVYFNHQQNGALPIGSLLEWDGKYYGVTHQGGLYNGGVLFVLDPSGCGNYQVLHHFDNANGGGPTGGLIEHGGKLYGIANAGGIYNGGVIFEYDPSGSGSYSIRHNFEDSSGRSPHGKPLLSSDKLYGMTYQGGSNGMGVLYEYDPAGSGTYQVKIHFNGTNGGFPIGSLIEYGGKFYGMTSQRGISGAGVIFEYDPAGAGSFLVKHHFNTANGGLPYGSLLEFNGKLFGMTYIGGSGGYGVLFEYDLTGSGTYLVRHHFDNTNGSNPKGNLTELYGKFYGGTNFGGNLGLGTLFEFDPADFGTYQVLKNLETDGCRPDIGSQLIVSSIPETNTEWFLDADDDNYSTGVAIIQCDSPGPDYKSTGLLGGDDCDDNDNTIYPGAPELCDSKDNDCNSLVDDNVPVSVPTGINSTVQSSSSVYLDWNDNNSADRYQVRYRIQGGGAWTNTGNIFVSHHTLTGLAANHVYQYQVRSRCTNANTSDWSAMQTFFTSTCGIPTGLAVSNIMANSAQVDWNPVGGAISYLIRYRKPGNSWTNTSSLVNSKTITGLQNNSPYEVQVASFCSSGSGAWSSSVMFHTPHSKPLKYNRYESNGTVGFFELTIFPNPLGREQTLRIQFENPADQEGILNIFDVHGRIVHLQQFQAETGSNQLTVERLNFNSGVYFVSINLGDSTLAKRLILK